MGFTKDNGGRPLAMRQGLGVGECLHCGAEFQRHDENQVWCSPRCRRKGNYDRMMAIPWKRRRHNKHQRTLARTPGPARDRMLARKRRWNQAHAEYVRAYQKARWARRRAGVVDTARPGPDAARVP